MPVRRFRYQIALGQLPGSWPSPAFGEVNPFMAPADVEDLPLTPSVVGVGVGLGNGHHVATDGNFYSQLPIDRDVPLSPLFCRDLCGRVVYLGPGPEVKDNEEWADYRLPEGTPPEEQNPFIPFIVFPRHCRDIPAGSPEVPEAAWLEEVLLCHFRCLEQPRAPRYLPSDAEPEDDMEAVAYYGANLYPYKLRLDTFYPDGYRLPQTQMVFARGAAQGANPAHAMALGQSFMQAWASRPEGMGYEAWLEALGEEQRESLFVQGCTIIPTFEAFNGCAVVGRDFSLQEYWPGRAVTGLHEIAEFRADTAPRGTILEVLAPGFVTATRVVQAQVVVSDGSGYVSPNAADPDPLIPNLNLPHSRTVPTWGVCPIPTHPRHFEEPTLFGFEPESGKFMQIYGPLWAPLYYFYGCTDYIIDAYDFPEPHPAGVGYVGVPEALKGRFWPVVPLMGYDTFDLDAPAARMEQGSRLRTMIVREPTEESQAGVAYHPLPLEFEFECEPFWFPVLHPLNRGYGPVPPELADNIAPVISPKVFPEAFKASIKGQGVIICPWVVDEELMGTPDESVVGNYPGLMRYLVPNMELAQVLRWAPEPLLSNMDEVMMLPASRWWNDGDEGAMMDTEEALGAWAGKAGAPLYEALWDMREACVTLTKFRHTLFRSNRELYTMAYWYGATPLAMQEMFLQDMASMEELEQKMMQNAQAEAPVAEAGKAPSAVATASITLAEDELSPEERAQLQALQNMAAAKERNRLLDEELANQVPGLKGPGMKGE